MGTASIFVRSLFWLSDLKLLDNEVATRSCNKKLKLQFHKVKLEMQSLSYVGPNQTVWRWCTFKRLLDIQKSHNVII